MIADDMKLGTKNLDNLYLNSLKKKFKLAKPFPHMVIKNFLQENYARKLAKALQKENFSEKDSDLFQFRQTEDLAFSKNHTLKDFHTFVNSRELITLMGKITNMSLSQGKTSLAGSLYIDTDYLLCHDDELEGRKIAYILYLCDDFSEKDGGALALLEDDNGKPGNIVQRYYPKWNSLMLFKVSKKSWHEVEEVLSSKKRYAVGGWFY